jgi:phage tail sheath protein FI
MPVSPTYPGIYIEELHSSAHTITAAPTSIAVFIGYTHPFKTKPENWGRAIELFGFTDYERDFGGLYNSGQLHSELAYAVYNFFLNGGAHAYVVGLPSGYYDSDGNRLADVTPASATSIDGIVFTALEPTDQIPITVKVSNIQASKSGAGAPLDMADITILYGARAETYRKLTLNSEDARLRPYFFETVINTRSALVRVSKEGDAYPTEFKPVAERLPPKEPLTLATTPPDKFASTFSPADFMEVFAQDSSLDKLSIFNLLAAPGVTDAGVLSEALAFCEHKHAFLIMDAPAEQSANQDGGAWIGDYMENLGPKSPNGALYFPYLKSPDPVTGRTLQLPPCGFVAGILARTDNDRGVWKAPAGLETTILNTTGVVESGLMNDMRQGTLNPLGVNCLRTLPNLGTIVFGARTLVADNPAFEEYRYVPVRRMALFLEQTLLRNLMWVVFEPNDEPLWVAIRTSIEGFMLSLFQQGAFQGQTPSQAFQVKCDSSTTTQTDIDNGIVNIVVAFRPLKPAEFVVIQIAQLAGQAQA